MKQSKIIFYSFCILFSILYLCVAATSTYHSITLFELANTFGWACLLAGTFEIANMAVTVMLLDSVAKKKTQRIMPWIMLTFTTFVQILGNIYATTSYMVENSVNGLKTFTEYILFFMNNPDEKTNIMIVALLIGAGLPLLALGLTAMVVNMLEAKRDETKDNTEEEKRNNEPEIIKLN